MRIFLMITTAILLAGCGSLPEPDAQIRLSEIHGAVEGSYVVVGGIGQGGGCILSVLGEIPERMSAKLKQGTCEAEVRAGDE
tara:strand:- start:7980 stop:8225 length:246 start_codon:yes stop_codon:yes gene_type:complete